MGRNLNTHQRVETINATLRHAFGQEKEFPRDAWDRSLLRHFGIGIEMAYKITQAGEILGYWRRVPGPTGGPNGGRRSGSVRLLPQEPPLETPLVSAEVAPVLASPTTNSLAS